MNQEEAEKAIRNAWIAGIISGVVTLLAIFFLAGFDLFNLIDVALIFGLTFGIYKKSRAAAVIMLIYYTISQILFRLEQGTMSGIFLTLVFLYFYFQGIRGTFAYHKLIKADGLAA
jgi:asparagine N-glycosylation enzyme membrane subunit Stt3